MPSQQWKESLNFWRGWQRKLKIKKLTSTLEEEKSLNDNKMNELLSVINKLKQKVKDIQDEQIDS